MDQVFAPWRIEWVERDHFESRDECVFCELPGEGADRANRIVAESEHVYVLLNNYPYNPGHLLVVPYRHTGEYQGLDSEKLLAHSTMQQRALTALQSTFDPDGYNIGFNLGTHSGGSIRDHIHSHIVPRWSGDTNFMPVISETKVIVEALDDSYDRLHETFRNLDGATVDDLEMAVQFED